MAGAAADLLVERSYGSPYLFQLIGDAAWTAGTGAVITREEAERGYATVRRELVAHFRLVLADLSDLQVAYLRNRRIAGA